jgi:hypothetical protein
MSHDLDSALRDSLRRHAESAPHVVDTDGIRVRAQQIQRRRTLESVAAAFVLLGVVVGLGAVIGSLRTDATPPPVTTGTATPTPTGTAPTTYADLPWVASVIPYRNPGGANETQPYGGNKLVVTVDGRQTVVYDAGNAALSLVGWFGPDHRSLLYITGQDVVNDLHRATFAEDGSVQSDEVLTIDGSFRGVATPLASGGFAWVPFQPGTFPGKDETVDYVDDSFQVVASRPAPAGAWLVTREVVVSRNGGTLTVTGDAGSATRTLPDSCTSAPALGPDGRGTETVSDDGRVAALECGTHVVLVSLDPSSPDGVTELPAVPGGGSVISAWFDPQGRTLVSSADEPRQTTSTSVRTSVWNSATQKWDTAYQQNVVSQVRSGDTAFSLYADKPGEDPDVTPPAWFSETTPHLQVSPTNATLESYGLTFAARPPAPTATPSASPSVATLPWIATVRSHDAAGQEGTEQVWVRIDGKEQLVDDTGNAATSVLGWYGPDHRTLVWEAGQDLMRLRAATFDADGSISTPAHDLEIPGVVSPLVGIALPVPDDGFVLWHQRASGKTEFDVYRVDQLLTVQSSAPSAGGAILFATSTAYAESQGNTIPTKEILVTRGGTTTRVRLPQTCDGTLAGVPSLDGQQVALRCGDQATGSSNTVALLDLTTLKVVNTALPEGLLRLWWDPSGVLHASIPNAQPDPTIHWRLESGTWVPDGDTSAELRVFPSTGPSLRWNSPASVGADGTWTAESDPEVDLGPGLAYSVFETGPGIAAR